MKISLLSSLDSFPSSGICAIDIRATGHGSVNLDTSVRRPLLNRQGRMKNEEQNLVVMSTNESPRKIRRDEPGSVESFSALFGGGYDWRKGAGQTNCDNDVVRSSDGSSTSGRQSMGITVQRFDGRSFISRSSVVSQGGERLKINLHLDLYRAKCLRQRGKLDLCEKILRQCIVDWPDDGRPYVALGKLFGKQNKIQEARAVLEGGCQAVRGENPFIWQAWAILEQKSGNLTKARQLFDAAIVADKRHVAAWHGWAVLELQSGNTKRAISLLNKGLRICGPNEYILQTLALIHVKAGMLEEARSCFSQATQHNSKSAATWLAWALMEAEHGLIETSRCLFQNGIAASPRNRYIWQAWALFEAKQGNNDLARELFERGHQLNPKDPVILQAHALFEFECGQPDVARELFKRALATDIYHQPVWIGWGWMEWKQGNVDVARDLYKGAIQTDSRSMNAVRAFQAWGVLEEREGNTGTARELFKCALKIDSQNAPAWMSWAAMEEREGRSVRAEEIRTQFLQQRTEVVDGLQWDVDLSELFAPAIDRIKGFLKLDQNLGQPKRSSKPLLSTDTSSRDYSVPANSFEGSQLGKFNVDQFLKEKFPWRYGAQKS